MLESSMSDSSPHASERGRRPNKIRLKCHYSKDIRVVRITNKMLFVSLKERLETDFGFQVSLKYKDTDGDMINLDNQNDLNELIETETGSVTVLVSQASGASSMGGTPRSVIMNSDDGDGELSSSRDSRLSATQSPLLRPLATESKLTVAIPDETRHTTPGSPVVAAAAPAPRPSVPVASAVPPDVIERAISSHERQKSRQRDLDAQRAVQASPWRWQRGEVLGQGAFGTVFLGLNLNSGELMAVKQLDTNEVTKKDLMLLEHEISMMRGMNHKNIVRYMGTDRTDDSLSIFMEYVPGGSIRSLLERFGALKESVVRMYTRQLLLGLEYLHQNGMAHRDIKGANILVANDGTIKLADFGASKNLTQPSLTTTGLKGTPMWMAPEVIRQQQTPNGWKKADVWSVGCTVVEMATGKPPWSQFDNPVTAMYQIACADALPSIPKELSEQGRHFLDKCLTRDPDSRPDATSLLLDPFVAFVSPWAVRSTPRQMMQRPSTSGDRGSRTRPSMQEYWPIRETHSRASSKKKGGDEELADSIELRPDVSISLNDSMSDNDDALSLSDGELNEELRAAISKNRQPMPMQSLSKSKNARAHMTGREHVLDQRSDSSLDKSVDLELDDSVDGEMTWHDTVLHESKREMLQRRSNTIAPAVDNPVLGSLQKHNDRGAHSHHNNVGAAVQFVKVPKRASTVGKHGSNMLKGMPPLLSSVSPSRGRNTSGSDGRLTASSRRSVSHHNRRAQTVGSVGGYLQPACHKPKRSHLRTQLVSFDPEDSLDDLESGQPVTHSPRTASAPTTSQLKHSSRRSRSRAKIPVIQQPPKRSISSRESHRRRNRGMSVMNEDSALQNGKNRRRPRSKRSAQKGLGGDASESSLGAREPTQEDLNGLVIGGVAMR